MNREKLRKVLRDNYSKEECFKLFKKYFLDWIAEGYIGKELNLFEISLISENSDKDFFLDLLEEIYTHGETFNKIFRTLPEEVKNCFTEIAWNRRKKILDKKIYFDFSGDYNLNLKLKDDFLFFKKISSEKKEIYLTLDTEIIKNITKHMKKPKDFYINPIEKIECEFIENNEERIQENISKYFSFFDEGNLQLSSSGKLLKESKNNLKKYCNIREYYNEVKDLEFIKTEIMGLFIFLFKDAYLTEKFFKNTNLKNIVEGFLSGKAIKSEDGTYINLYLNYLKGIKNLESNDLKIKEGLNTIRKIIDEFPDDNYVSIDNIIKAILYRDEKIEIIDIKGALSKLYINEANYERSKITGYDNYIEYIIIPFIKSVFFILASLGVVEIAYKKPEFAKTLYLKSGYLNKYNGAEYVKFTELGRYVFNRVKSYNFRVIDDVKVEFDEDRLIVTLTGENPTKRTLLEKMAEKITPNRFKFSEESFKKGIENSLELKQRIDEIKGKFGDNFPKIWNEFFEEMTEKIDIFKKKEDYEVFLLKDNKELREIIMRDERFEKLLLKAEKFHVIVKKNRLSKLKELFREYGYFM